MTRVFSAKMILLGAIYDAQLQLNKDDSKNALKLLKNGIKRLEKIEARPDWRVRW